MQDQKVAVVTGSSTGIGFETSLTLARNGFYTYATMRKSDEEKSRPLTEVAKNENYKLLDLMSIMTNLLQMLLIQ
jgi:NAD(P)-dependent dehydrogenase (short-subunit alcohol dehydrogenase family)